MSQSLCGANCAECPTKDACKGCVETKGCPFGKQCFVGKYILTGGVENYQAFKNELIAEINALNIPGMEKVKDLSPLVGNFVNLEYPLPNGGTVKFLKDDEVYLGAQAENLFSDHQSCYGVIARESFILVCEYGENGADPEIVVFQRR